MAKEQDVLFCKIAIHNKLVTKEQAQDCLREAGEAGSDVGEIFQDKLLLTSEQVARIWEAVERVPAKAAPAGGAPAARPAARPAPRAARAEGAPRAGGRRGRRPPVEEEEEPPHPRHHQRQDPARMAMVIGSFVLFAGIMVAMAVMVLSGGGMSAPEGSGAGKTTAPSTSPSGGGAAAKTAAPTPVAPATPTLSEEDKLRIRNAATTALSDARMAKSDGNFRSGIDQIDGFLAKEGAGVDADLRTQLENERNELLAKVSERLAEVEAEMKGLLGQGKTAEARAALEDSDPSRWATAEGRKKLEALLEGK